MNYNTSLQLWDSPACRKAYPSVSIQDGHVIAGGQAIARFDSDASAKTTLRKAGWHFDNAGNGNVGSDSEAF